MAFLRNLLSTLLAMILFTVIGFLILFGILSVVSSSDNVPKVKANSILHFDLRGLLMEKAEEDIFLEALDFAPQQYGLLNMLETIHYAKTDERIKGIYLGPMYLSAGYAGLQELRDALLDFKESGKFVYAYGEYISEANYYLLSVADSLFVNPTGAIEFNGLSANITFYKGMFEKLDIEPEIFRVGEYKSYVEPYMRKNLSDQNRLQYRELLLSIYGDYLSNLSLSVKKPVETLRDISNLMKVQLPIDADSLGLIHKVGYPDELLSVMREKLGIKENQKMPFIAVNKYSKAIAKEKKYSKNRIAIIVAQGNIAMGGDAGIVGEAFAKEIRKARENDRIKAIVIRINSGGGSMTASDLIWRELMLTKGEKPVIASMADAAASGGYYIAMPADTIVAQSNTVTGSIGIFGLWFNFSGFLENKIGITHDVVKTGEFSDIYTATRKLSPHERQIIQGTVDEGYETFVYKVAQNRKMAVDDVKAIAGGRVWSGKQAKENGLVDILGSFDDAVKIAAQKAGIAHDYQLAYYPKQKPFIQEFVNRLTSSFQTKLFGTEIDPIVRQLEELKKMQGLQARMAQDLEIQ